LDRLGPAKEVAQIGVERRIRQSEFDFLHRPTRRRPACTSSQSSS
jgi:hypothetical protein